MANAYDFLGDDAEYFMKSSWQVYNNLNGNRQYVGKTGNEKTMSPNQELVEWFDNTTGTQYLFVVDIDKFDLSVGFNFMQIADPNVLAVAWNLDLDLADPNIIYAHGGTAPNTLATAEWRFVGRTRTNLGITLVLRNAICVPNGDFVSGAPGDYTNVPVNVRCLQDTSVGNTSRDLFYFMIDRRNFS